MSIFVSHLVFVYSLTIYKIRASTFYVALRINSTFNDFKEYCFHLSNYVKCLISCEKKVIFINLFFGFRYEHFKLYKCLKKYIGFSRGYRNYWQCRHHFIANNYKFGSYFFKDEICLFRFLLFRKTCYFE